MSPDRKRTSPTESGRMGSAVWEHSGAGISEPSVRTGPVGLPVRRALST